MTAPCRCWTGPAVLHEGHCCFGDDPTPLDEIVPGVPPPCGHWAGEPYRAEETEHV